MPDENGIKIIVDILFNMLEKNHILFVLQIFIKACIQAPFYYMLVNELYRATELSFMELPEHMLQVEY